MKVSLRLMTMVMVCSSVGFAGVITKNDAGVTFVGECYSSGRYHTGAYNVLKITVTNYTAQPKRITPENVFNDKKFVVMDYKALQQLVHNEDCNEIRELLYPYVPASYVLLPGKRFMHMSAFDYANEQLCDCFALAPGKSESIVIFVGKVFERFTLS